MLSNYDNFTKALLKVGIELWVGSLTVGLVGGALSYWITRRLLERYRVRRKGGKHRMSNHGKRTTHKLILASKSPRRAQLLRQAGYEFSVVEAPVAEPSVEQAHLPPAMQAEALSYFKAKAAATVCGDGVILAADTVVALGDRVFGKPEDADDARRILGALAGTTHHVITGVTVFEPATGRRKITHDATCVRMRELTDSQVSKYIAGGNWQGKAGAYGIQDRDDPFVERLQGSFSNVVGLPLELVAKLLAQFDCRPSTTGKPAAGDA